MNGLSETSRPSCEPKIEPSVPTSTATPSIFTVSATVTHLPLTKTRSVVSVVPFALVATTTLSNVPSACRPLQVRVSRSRPLSVSLPVIVRE